MQLHRIFLVTGLGTAKLRHLETQRRGSAGCQSMAMTAQLAQPGYSIRTPA